MRPYCDPRLELRWWDLDSFNQLWLDSLGDYTRIPSESDQFRVDDGSVVRFCGSFAPPGLAEGAGTVR